MSSSSRLAAALLGMLAAGAVRAETVEDTVAVVNGKPILGSEYRKDLATALDYWAKTSPAVMSDPVNLRRLKEGTLEELITRELLVQEGHRLELKVREREVENAIEEIKGRFKKDELGRDLPDDKAAAAFQQQLKNEGIDYAQFRERLTRQILARKVIDEEVKSKIQPPSEEEGRAYFSKITAYIASRSTEPPKGMDEDSAQALREASLQVRQLSSERVHVKRILIRLSPGASENERRRALKTAQQIKKRLDDGEDFDKLAREESEDPESAANGGDIGFVLRGVAPPALDKVVFSLKLNEVGDPVLTDLGYNIVKVTGKLAAETPKYERFKEDIANFLSSVAFHKRLEAYIKGLREKAVIERHLPDIAQKS